MTKPLRLRHFVWYRIVPKAARKLWRQLRCAHTHTFTFLLDGATRVYGNPHGSRRCKTPGLMLTGCYQCGRVEVEDYRA